MNTAVTALWATRTALDVTAQNVANVNTDGYSRQRVDLQAVGGSAIPAMHSISSGIGTGVTVNDVARIRDSFLEIRAQTETGNLANLKTKDATLSSIETAFGEPGDSGLQSVLSDYWAGWDDVANQPGDLASRSQMLQRAGQVVDNLKAVSTSLGAQWSGDRVQLAATIQDVNATAASVADLNTAIRRATQSGLPAADLTDQRDLLVLHLAGAVGSTVRPGKDGTVDVYLGGNALVRGSDAESLRVDGATSPALAAGNPPRVSWVRDGYPAVPGGIAGGQLDALNVTIPNYQAKLNTTAAAIASQVNTLHVTGFDLDGNPGQPVFTGGPPVTAGNITVAITDPRAVAAALVPTTPPAQPSLDAGLADAIAQIRFGTASPDAGYRQTVVDLGVQKQGTSRAVTIQSAITNQVNYSRESISGVNLDEEMTNMVGFQHAYEAAARLITAIDEMLDTLINRTGQVGR
ncbi:MAG: flagellar hook-associated protein FlgK [Propionicimonas sp.]